jgi:hypothetical protein
MTAPGRKTGRLYSTRVDTIERDGYHWLVAGYGSTNRVLKTRAAMKVALSRGRRMERLKVDGVASESAVTVLRDRQALAHDARATQVRADLSVTPRGRSVMSR